MQFSDRRIAGVVLLAAVLASRAEAAEKAPVPDAEAQRPVRKAAADLFAERFRSAATDSQKTELAQEMIKAAIDAPDGSTDQYVLLSIAAEVAAAAGDAPRALAAAEQLSARFQVKAEKLKADAFLSAARHAGKSTQCRAVAEAAAGLVTELSRAEEFDAAIEVCEAARSAAREARQYVLARDMATRVDELKQQQAATAQYRESVAALEKNPSDPAANLAAGRYLCFVLGDWKRGVSMLALGGDEQLKTLALKELAAPSTAKEQAELGDAWWELAQTREGSEKQSSMVRAGTWYREASGGLNGLAQVKVEKRVEELTKAGIDVPELFPAPPLANSPLDEKKAKQLQADWAEYLGVSVEQGVDLGDGVQFTMVLIPPGEFVMGSSKVEQEAVIRAARAAHDQWLHEFVACVASEGPQHRVKITRPFYLGKCTVTQAQWETVMHSNPASSKNPNNPVDRVSWNDVQSFLAKLNAKRTSFPQSAGRSARAPKMEFALPTEAQWEYACRAGTTTRFYFGDDEAKFGDYGYYASNSNGNVNPVGQRKPNAWGLCDMLGNVRQWCADWWAPDYYAHSPQADPRGASTGTVRAHRGGAWYFPARYCRAACRSRVAPDQQGVVGVRLALVPVE